MKKLFIAVFLILLTLLGIFYSTRDSSPTEYIVAIDYIPNSLNPSETRTNIEAFISLQLYYPLIAIDDHGHLNSHFLDLIKTKSVDQNFDNYAFCMLDNITFSNGDKIKINHILEGIKKNKEIKDNILKIHKSKDDNNCFYLKLKQADAFFLHKFHNIASTPTTSSSTNFVTGLGPYRVRSMNASEINLEQTTNEKVGQFKNVKFVLTKTLNEKSFKGFIDKNHIAHQKSRTFNSPEMIYFRRPSQKIYVLVVNYLDDKIAKSFARCFPREEFIKIQTKPLNSIPGFLPKGVVGSDVSWQELMQPQNSECALKNITPITLLHYEQENYEDVSNLLNKYKTSMPIPIILKKIEGQSFINAIFNDKNTLSLIGFDTSADEVVRKIEVMKYFQSFVNESREKRLVTKVNKELALLFHKSLNTSLSTDVQTHVKKTHKELLTSGQIIPLGELDIVYEYPRNLENIVWLGNSGGINGYPDISKMEWTHSLMDRLFVW